MSEREEPPGGRIERIEIENFKSYRGRQNIGPFKEFTCVIGPNGSGKSNLMDAISFVLGVKTSQLRGSLRELLFSDSASSSPQDRPRTGHVTLVFEDQAGHQTHFSRVLAPSSSSADAAYASQYKVNNRTVSAEAYNKKLESFGILVKARNFLVFQVRCSPHRLPGPSLAVWQSDAVSSHSSHCWFWC